MKRITYDPTIKISGRELRINADPAKGYGCFIEILHAVDSQMCAMLSHHSRMLMVRIDLHMTEYTADNRIMSAFMKTLIRRLKKRYGLSRIGYVWAREMETAKKQHYHIALLLDGHKIQHPENVITAMEEVWQEMGQPKPFTPSMAYTRVHRKDPSSYAEAFHRLSYLAKWRGKGYRSKSANDYSTSRIKMKASTK